MEGTGGTAPDTKTVGERCSTRERHRPEETAGDRATKADCRHRGREKTETYLLAERLTPANEAVEGAGVAHSEAIRERDGNRQRQKQRQRQPVGHQAQRQQTAN